jgi:hypothetical protein
MVICSFYGIFTYMVIFGVNADKLVHTWSIWDGDVYLVHQLDG